MNKRGMYYDVALAVIVFAILLTATIVTENKKAKFNGIVGEQQFKLIKEYQDLEKNLYYIDRFATMVLSDSIAKITKEGGEKNIDCGTYQNLNLWSAQGLDAKEVKTCYPNIEKIKEAIIKDVKNRWPNDFPNAPILTKLLPKEETPNIIFNGKTLYIYKAKNYIKTNIQFGEYSVLPRFKIETSFNVNEFDEAKELAEKVIDECAKEGGDSLIKCVYSTKAEQGTSFRKMDCQEETVEKIALNPLKNLFSARTFPVCYPANTTMMTGKPNIIFALFIPDKRELDPLAIAGIISGGILGTNPLLNILQKMDFNIKEINLYKLVNLDDALPSTFYILHDQKMTLDYQIPGYDENQEYYYNLRLTTADNLNYDYKIKVLNGKTEIVK